VLLSSLQGAAVTSIKIDGVLHEFSSLAGVREDVTDIVLNVKQVALKMEGEGPKRLHLSATGPAEVTAGMIATSGDIEVTNPELVICHLDEGATLNMELTVDIGKGYQPAAANRPADAPIGLIPVDALYSPVRQVAYKVENTRVGQELDYDKLTLTIETDGTVTPEDALAYSARILQDQLQLFVHFDESQVRMAPSPMIGQAMPMAEAAPADTNQLNRYLLKKVDELELSVRRTTISSTLATSFRRPRPKCSARRTSAARASTRSRKCSRPWAFVSEWTSPDGRPRISKRWPRSSSRKCSAKAESLRRKREGPLHRGGPFSLRPHRFNPASLTGALAVNSPPAGPDRAGLARKSPASSATLGLTWGNGNRHGHYDQIAAEPL
jgi:DNA-directed RNA polymerase alpha subunit